MQFPTEFNAEKVTLEIAPQSIFSGNYFEQAEPISLSATNLSWQISGANSLSLNREDILDALVYGFKAAAQKLAEMTDRDDVYLDQDCVKVRFTGAALEETAFNATPEEEEV